MEPEFWLQRWQENKIGFHLDEVNPLLVTYFPQLSIKPPARVFVPMCGKSVDMVWLRTQGYEVVAVEISLLAIETFFHEQQLQAQVDTIDGINRWRAQGIDIWCGDFFKLSATRLGEIDAIYDRAALIAMPENKRSDYAQHLLAITRQAPQLLITLEYPQAQMTGPPFSVPTAEVRELYGDVYPGLLAPMVSKDVLAEHDHFAARGLTALHENVFRLQVLKK